MSSILNRLLEKGLPTRDVQIATTGEQQQRPLKFEGAQEGNFYNSDLLVVGGQDNGGFARHLNLDDHGRMVITGQAGGNTGGTIVPVHIHGQAGEGANLTSAVNPVLIGGRYDATPRALADGQHGALAVNSEGKLMIDLQNASLTATVNVDIDQSTDSIQLYANDGTANRAVRSDATGRFQMVGGAAADAAFADAGNPVMTAARGTDNNIHHVLSDPSGRQIMVGHAASGAAATANPVLVSGSDGTNTRSLATDTSGRQVVVGAASNGSAAVGNPLLIAGIDGSNNVNTLAIDGTGSLGIKTAQTENAANPDSLFAIAGRYDAAPRTLTSGNVGAIAVSAEGHVLVDISQSSSSSTQIYGNDGTTNRAILTNAAGNLLVAGAAAAGAVLSGNPLLNAGSDGTNIRTLYTDASGRQVMVGAGSAGSAITGNPVLIAGSDGTNARNLSTDTSGRLAMVGAGAAGSAVVGNPVLIAGTDGSSTRSLTTDASGRQIMVGAAAEMAPVAGNPILLGASTNTGAVAYVRSNNAGVLLVNARGQDDIGSDLAIRQDSNRNVLIGGALAAASDINDVAVNPVLTGGLDSTGLVRYARITADGAAVMVGLTNNGDAAASAPVLTAGVDSSNNTRTIATDAQGVVKVRADVTLPVMLHGSNPGTTTAQVLLTPTSDVFGSAAALMPLVDAQLFNVTSSSAANSFTLNTGCTQVVLSGIDENNLFVTETVQLDGTTPVSTVNKFFAFYKAYAYDMLDTASYITVRPSAGGSVNVDYVYISNETTYIPILYCPDGYNLRVNALSIHTNALATFSLQGYNRNLMAGPSHKLSGVKTYWRNQYIQAYNVDLGARGLAHLEAGDYLFVVNESGINNTNIGDTLVSLFTEYRTIL